jgi:acyl carrier protein
MQESEIKHSKQTLQRWLTQHIASYVKLKPEKVKLDVPIAEYGIDSVYSLALVGDIEEYLNISVEQTVLWDNPTIESLAKALLNSVINHDCQLIE